MAGKTVSFLRDLIIFIVSCAITYKLPGFLLFCLDNKHLLINLFALPIGAVCSIIQSVFSSSRLSGAIFVVLFGIYLTISYIQAFFLTDFLGKAFCIIGIIGIISNIINQFK